MKYDYQTSIKSTLSDEWVGTYVNRPIAGLIVRGVYGTRVTPNHLTIASVVCGLAAAPLYLRGEPLAIACGGLCIFAKDILDSADGQLARARSQFSRMGRFLDSIGDFLVNLLVFFAIGWMLFRSSSDWRFLVLAFLSVLGTSLRVSYHVFYQTSYLHMQGSYLTNRVTEETTPEDVAKGGTELVLQKIFQTVYGWQDRLILRIDRWCRRDVEDGRLLERWYCDGTGLRLTGLTGLGTELMLLTVCSLANILEPYFYLNLFLMNFLSASSVFYRRSLLSRRLEAI